VASLKPNSNEVNTMTIHIAQLPQRQEDVRPRVPHTAHLRELELVDGRRLLLDRRSIAFLCQGKPEEFGGKQVTVVGFKTMARACPVTARYHDLKAWWRGDKAMNGQEAQS
jgi:hypothetical protein